ncbi:MAG TPA: FAD-dependent oxidoreductase, partial [Trueperaceae bacterium]
VYYDGQFDDARMNIALVLTAVAEGATVANYLEVEALTKNGGRLAGATLRDKLSGQTLDVSASVVINATGPFTDTIRQMDDPNATPMLSTSSGSHVVLDKRFSPPETGLLIPQTEDGRVLFLLPWLGHTLVGTTDHPAPLQANPKATEDDIEYILRHVRKYFSLPVERKDVLASWAGLRPLVSDPHAADTAKLSRDHVINISPSGLLTIAGGKWTTYRKMALDTVDHAIDLGGFTAGPSRTESLVLVGGRNYSPAGTGALQERYGLDLDIASYLNRAYGDCAPVVAGMAVDGLGARLVAGQPYLEAEVLYGALHESARTIEDLLARRLRLSFLDHQGTLAAIPRVAELMAQALGWNVEKKAAAEERARAYFA